MAVIKHIFDKPLMHSEFGAFDHIGDCDNGSEFKKILCLKPFTGAACSMNWDWQYPGETDLWPQIGIIEEFLNGIKLDEENWQVGMPIISSNKGVEVYYLRNYVTDNYRAVGVVSNRTYNYYTQGAGSLCTVLSSEFNSNPIYQVSQDFEHPIDSETLILPNMGDEVEYKVNWYNALTGVSLGTGLNSSDNNGDFPLYFPLVSGDESRPILFFEIYRSDQPTFKSSELDSTEAPREFVEIDHYDIETTLIVATNWEQTTNVDILLFPNPASDVVHVKVYTNLLIGSKWQLLNAQGQEIQSGALNDFILTLDLTNYTDGIYLFKLISNSITYEYKIIKS